MFEVGKLTDESLDSFITELGKVGTHTHPQPVITRGARGWAATGIVVRWFVCLFVVYNSQSLLTCIIISPSWDNESTTASSIY